MVRRFVASFVLAGALLATSAVSALAADWHVDVVNGSDASSGDTTATPFKSITRGLEAATAGDTVHVAVGSYEVTTSGEAFPLVLKSGVVLQGAGAEQVTIRGTGDSAVVRGANLDAGSRIDGFTVTGGDPGLDFTASRTTVSNNVITGNRGEYSGAGVHSDGGELHIFGNRIERNWAWFGAGICSEYSDRSTIEDNTIEDNSGYYGVGVGAYYHAEPTIRRTIIRGNVANAEGWSGRACGAGIVAESASLPRVYESVITGNRAEGADATGGAIHLYSASAKLTNCLVTGNTAADYAISGLNSGLTEIVHSTIADNTPAGIGRTSASWPFAVDIRNSIVRGNGSTELEPESAGSVTYTDIEGGWTGEGNIDADPLFVAPGSDYRLTALSPCIDAAAEATTVPTDLDGNLRPQGFGWDMGAFERVGSPPIVEAPAVPGPVRLGSACAVSAEFADAGVGDTHVATIDWGDGTESPATITEDAGRGTATGTHVYAAPGLYRVSVRVLDDDGEATERAALDECVVYDPAGLTLSLGTSASPSGASADARLSGPVRFSFSSRYANGASVPQGAIGLDFRSTGAKFYAPSEQWLVVSRTSRSAVLQGRGTIDGAASPSGGPYVCRIWANDAAPDTLRVRISYRTADDADVVVYDTGTPVRITSGAIVVNRR
ncbi:MAG: DUF1565 domain-containing protein [Coriobacteriales bacterium]|nr:DUF1565 domain-containing protein [Coriobacteriales bacterium]